jgi:hypothetical protein
MSRYTNQGRVQEFALTQLITGDFYSVSELFQGVGNTNSKTIVLENNRTEDALFLVEPTARSSGQLFIEYLRNVSVDTVGTELDLNNKRTDGNDNPTEYRVTTAGDNETGVVSGGKTFNEITVGSGSNAANASPGTTAESGEVGLIMPGDNIAITATNESGSTQDISQTLGVISIAADKLP